MTADRAQTVLDTIKTAGYWGWLEPDDVGWTVALALQDTPRLMHLAEGLGCTLSKHATKLVIA